jgi:glycosyltransferase involved in cell wall biosynthesis
MHLSDDEKSKSKLIICGKGDQQEELQHLARGQNHIVLAGWRNAAEIHVLLRRCHYGTFPYRSTPDFVNHYPNKIGEYLGAGLPIMTGLKGLVRSLLEPRGLGYFYEEGDVRSAADCLRRIAADHPNLDRRRKDALQVYYELFDPEQIYDGFCEHLVRIAASARPAL